MPSKRNNHGADDTDVQFHVFNFQICLPWLFTQKRAYSAHTMST